MGTSFTVHAASCPFINCGSLTTQIDNRLTNLTQQLSHYEADSELSAFNKHPGTDWFPVSDDLFTVVEYALDLSNRSNGAFDVTVAPAVNAWGFGPAASDQIPNETRIARAIQLTGFEKISTRAPHPHGTQGDYSPALRKNNPGVTLDLSAIAKGYAVDQLALLLESNGINNYLVEIGGEIRTAGIHPKGHPWRIGIEPPDAGLSISYIITPGIEAIATSGDYRNYYMVNGERIAHTIDPRTGRPVNHNLASVSVVLPTAGQADAIATLMMVLGPEAGLELAETQNIPALFFVREPNKMHAFYSTAMQNYLLKN
ncbi:MAG: FAD:protein FMN transferase [Gammaproteobacteria bacterium]|nr:FAD:protein FMN transferase [Gammaproteobacteria bacterium]MCP4089517.1 FAD:protein FMN transferase [Gammaproteobacteria bacterium]MCP4276223.1 FAD:protein FMN transferase [Gammaproteobacteria bacterium]MCP4832920.1 FAD:protein FMN transferase [Gammaproteobacteria bacterium]MCP4930045.1 FAD:protein FMN transferase [Gammaproteobacteria bacterium]